MEEGEVSARRRSTAKQVMESVELQPGASEHGLPEPGSAFSWQELHCAPRALLSLQEMGHPQDPLPGQFRASLHLHGGFPCLCCPSLPDHFPHYPPTVPFPDLSAHVVPVLKVSHAEEEEGECCPFAFCSFYPLSVCCKPCAHRYPGMPTWPWDSPAVLHSQPVLSAGQDRRVVVDTNDLEYESMYGEQEDYDTALDADSSEQLAEDGELPVPHGGPGVAQVTPWCKGCHCSAGNPLHQACAWGGRSSSTWFARALGSPCS